MTVDLLRRAQVPLAELAAGPEFSFARWRSVVEMRRALEDFYLAVDIPAVGDAFFDALVECGLAPAPRHWTAAGEPAPKPASMRMVLARPGRLPLDRATREFLEERVGARTGCRVRAMTGVLPPRLEVTFPASADASSPMEEAADGYLCQLAVDHHVATHHLTAISPTPRQVSRGSSWSDPDVGQPVSVFDLHPPTADTE
ncbi:hypothetical protein [Ornithinicoccus halotolerans]|uniref:hypothetical protein n=1 Tax=Ornithinicoccus halotolerans TaxID=1748220 RepID=UPI0012980B0C|nr:hypothetical protein [Ornithinicoccus halotolerans]